MDERTDPCSMNYPASYYQSQQRDSQSSAFGIFPAILKRIRPLSVIDVGCGVGNFLYPFKMMGCDIVGVDGPWISSDLLLIPEADFLGYDLEESFPSLPHKYDLALCLETAEHLTFGRADALVAYLSHASNNILFSAATPGQGGHCHYNEQAHSFWYEKFAAHGFRADESIREDVNLPSVASWYKNNLVWMEKL